MRGFHDLLRQKMSSVFMLFESSSVSLTSDDLICVSEFGGQNAGVQGLDVMSQVPYNCSLVQMIKTHNVN
jgi:hypothetical protein